MTNEQIIELAKEHLEEFDRGQLIEFAREIAEIEYNREEVEYFIVTDSTGLVGDPQ